MRLGSAYKKAIAQGIAGIAVIRRLHFLACRHVGFTVYLALYDRPFLERR